MKLAAELVSKGATMLADPCPRDGGVQVRYRGKVYCTVHDDLSATAGATTVTREGVMAQMREVLLERLSEVVVALRQEKDVARQEQLVELASHCFELLEKLPQK